MNGGKLFFIQDPLAGRAAKKQPMGDLGEHLAYGSESLRGKVMAISCWGYVPDDLEIVFEPVMTTSPAERAELVQKLSSDVFEAFKCGLLTQQQALEELKARGE